MAKTGSQLQTKDEYFHTNKYVGINSPQRASILLPPTNGLYRTQQIALLVRYALISHFVNRTIAPLSLILIAPPEEDKTRILLKFQKMPNTKTIENLSSKPLNQLIMKQDEKQTIHHLIILDFIRTLQHKATVVDAVIGTLLNLIDEGVQENLFYGEEFKLKHRVQMGIITAITPPLFRKHFPRWNENGAISRFIPCSYEYTPDTIHEVNRYISLNLPVEVDKTLEQVKRRGKQTITINSDISAAIMLLTEEVTERLLKFYVTRYAGKRQYRIYLDLKGFRLQKMLRLLAQSIAYDRGRNEVNYEDLATLRELSELIRFPNDPKAI